MKKNDGASDLLNSPFIVPIFIMNRGCPNRCIFCNQRATAGNYPPKVTKDYFDATVRSSLAWNQTKSRHVEIAFYGGSFTGMDSAYQEELLSYAHAFIQKGLVHAIRVSTRPDYITEDKLLLLKKYNVGTVEIGAQSFVDDILQSAQRGHRADSIAQSILILKKLGFRTGLHLMVGLPLETKEQFLYSIDQTVKIRPDAVRIHPVIVFNDTALAVEFREGRYIPLELSEAVELCCLAWEKLSLAGIRIIRMGVHITPEMEKSGMVLAGPIHPAFGSLVLDSVFYDYTRRLLQKASDSVKEFRFQLSQKDISNFRGQNNANTKAIKKLYPHTNLIVESNPGQVRGEISLTIDSKESFYLKIPGMH